MPPLAILAILSCIAGRHRSKRHASLSAPDNTITPGIAVAATAAFNYFLTNKPFEKVVFHRHLPWVFQFGPDRDRDGLLVMFGQLMSIGGNDPKDRLWAQVEANDATLIVVVNYTVRSTNATQVAQFERTV